MRLIKELDGESININVIENMIKKDISLSYKLLKAANSAYHTLKRKSTSIEVKEALLKKKNVFFELLSLIIEYENGNWDEVNELSVNFGLSENIISDCYLAAIQNLRSLEKIYNKMHIAKFRKIF